MFTAQGLYYASSSSDGVSACTSPSTQALQSNWCTSTAVMSASGSSSPVWKSTSESLPPRILISARLLALSSFHHKSKLDADVTQLVRH